MALTLSRPPFRAPSPAINSMAGGGGNFLNTRYLKDSQRERQKDGVPHSIATSWLAEGYSIYNVCAEAGLCVPANSNQKS